MSSLSNLILFAQTRSAEAAASGGASSAAWALVIFLVILGMLVTLASSRRTIEIKRQKED